MEEIKYSGKKLKPNEGTGKIMMMKKEIERQIKNKEQ